MIRPEAKSFEATLFGEIARAVRCGVGTDPQGWEAKNAGNIGDCSAGRAEHPSQIRARLARPTIQEWR